MNNTSLEFFEGLFCLLLQRLVVSPLYPVPVANKDILNYSVLAKIQNLYYLMLVMDMNTTSMTVNVQITDRSNHIVTHKFLTAKQFSVKVL